MFTKLKEFKTKGKELSSQIIYKNEYKMGSEKSKFFKNKTEIQIQKNQVKEQIEYFNFMN